VVYQRWDSYNPPRFGYRAAYLHQVTLEDSLFGWLYNDGQDDFGRSQVPYFVCYYYSGRLHAVQLENIFNCLDRGPVALIDQQLPAALEPIVFPDLVGYQPSRIGVVIPSDVRDRSYVAIEQRRLLDLFVPVDGEIVIELSGQIYKQQSVQLSVTATPIPQAPPFGQDTIPVLQSKRSELQVGSYPSDASVSTSPKKSAWLIGIATGVASVALVFGSYHSLRQTVPAAKVQQYPVSTLSTNTSLRKIALVSTLTGHSGAVWSVALSPDGQTLASGSADKTIKVWNLDTGQLRRTITGHSDIIRSVTFSPDGQTLASGSGDKTIKLWNLQTGQIRTLSGHSGPVWSIAISPDGQTLASGSGDNTIKIWNIQTGKLVRTLTGHSKRVFSVALNPDGQTIASGSEDKTIKIWNLQTGELIRTLSGHSDAVRAVAFSPDAEKLASSSWDKTIKIWNLRTGKPSTFGGHRDRVVSVAFSNDSQTLASTSLDNTIKIWHVQTGKLLQILSGHSDWVLSVATSPTGQTLVSSSKDKTIKIWQ
jgi:WD40 repeat protein